MGGWVVGWMGGAELGVGDGDPVGAGACAHALLVSPCSRAAHLGYFASWARPSPSLVAVWVPGPIVLVPAGTDQALGLSQ